MNYNLAAPFYREACSRPDRVALHVSGIAFSYGELADLVARAAHGLRGARKVGILASRSLGTYVGLLGAAWAGAAYVPLSPKLPDDRLRRIIRIIGLDALVVDAAGRERLSSLELSGDSLPILDLSGDMDALPSERVAAPVEQGARELAYVLFTSGTTGVPKGVRIRLGSVAQFLDAMRERFSPCPWDRVSQTSELAFDVSVFEMFIAWGAGASVHVVPANQLLAPGGFISQQELTIWSSVPSIATFMRRMGMLKPGAFPTLRYTVFAGEALPCSLAEAWQCAAPASVVENLYGPTEATVYCLGSTIGPENPPTPERNTVPSGRPLPGVEAAILSLDLRFLEPGAHGQLAIAGGQLAEGYHDEPALTAQAFPVIEGKRWYLTGDLAYQDHLGRFHHLGRIDHQVKILGQRVELEEIEIHLREQSGCDDAAAIPWPVVEGVATGITAFIGGGDRPLAGLRERLAGMLPAYMVPQRIINLPVLPLNASGKIDRRALVQTLQDPAERPVLVP